MLRRCARPHASVRGGLSGLKEIMSSPKDELIKGTCHGILIGCILPVLAYNILEGKIKNVLMCGAYLGLLLVEGIALVDHYRKMR